MTETERAVHPAAAAFRMLAEDALASLAASIKTTGLLHPIILDEHGAVVAGRNRLAACRIAGVEPTFEPLGDRDPFEVALAENEDRRHDTVGQRALAIAKLIQASKNTASGKKPLRASAAARLYEIGPNRISEAAYLLKHATDLAEQVEAGASLTVAHKAALERNETAIEREKARARREEQQRERLAAIDRDREAIKAQIDAIQAELSEPVEIPPEPDFEITLERHDDGTPSITEIDRTDGPDMKAQLKVLGRFRAVVAEIEALGNEIVMADDYWWLDGHVKSIRAWGSRIIAATHTTVERHNALLAQNRHLRSLP